ncbi:MAG: hypothetical protein Q8R25_01870 [bacterium]|nr:hypothetical protein [bacterium]
MVTDPITNDPITTKGWGKGGVRGFLSFLFGLPASTTVGELRAEMTATTTNSIGSGQGSSTSKSQGLGFWARILGVFHFGKGN